MKYAQCHLNARYRVLQALVRSVTVHDAQMNHAAARCRVLVGGLAALIAIVVCFCFSKDLVVFLEAPVASKGVRFLQLSPGEFFFTTFKVPSPTSFRIPLLPCSSVWYRAK